MSALGQKQTFAVQKGIGNSREARRGCYKRLCLNRIELIRINRQLIALLLRHRMVTAVVLEALQVFTPDRHADFHAALYGACGALAQALLATLFIRVRTAYYRHRFLKRQAL
jgi:hypothetical protein